MWSIPVLLDCGDYNGYVAIPPGNKYYGKSYGEITLDIDVHGGLTYSEPVILGEKTFVAGIPISPEYIGKRNYILEDAEYITDNTEIGDDWWIFGFDTMHHGDTPEKWDREAVVKETMKLMKQLTKE